MRIGCSCLQHAWDCGQRQPSIQVWLTYRHTTRVTSSLNLEAFKAEIARAPGADELLQGIVSKYASVLAAIAAGCTGIIGETKQAKNCSTLAHPEPLGLPPRNWPRPAKMPLGSST